jgi:DNA topoisomerase-3
MNNPFVSAPVSASVPASSSQAVTIIGTAAPQTADDDDDTEDNTSNVPSSDSAPTVMCKCNPPAQAAKNTVKKEGPNKGKEFYSCAKYMTDTSRCKFFEWADKIAQQQ